MNKKSFSTSTNTAVISSTYVLKEKQPVLHVVHDDQDEWQFHCGNHDYSSEKLMLVTLANMLDYDSTLVELADLPINHFATRDSESDSWRYEKQ